MTRQHEVRTKPCANETEAVLAIAAERHGVVRSEHYVGVARPLSGNDFLILRVE